MVASAAAILASMLCRSSSSLSFFSLSSSSFSRLQRAASARIRRRSCSAAEATHAALRSSSAASAARLSASSFSRAFFAASAFACLSFSRSSCLFASIQGESERETETERMRKIKRGHLRRSETHHAHMILCQRHDLMSEKLNTFSAIKNSLPSCFITIS
jgi:hypothetical protein